jgi:hypothetical protein
MRKTNLPLATKAAKGRSVALTAETLVNMYAEKSPQGARNAVTVIGCPGAALFSTISADDYIRGVYWVPSAGDLWVVAGLSLYKINSFGSSSTIGAIGGYGRVSMSDNGTQLCITTEAITYIVTLASDTLSAVTDSDFPNSDTVAYLGGYFFFNNNQPGSEGQLFWSELYEGSDYDALDFATAENAPDNLVAVWRDHDRLLLFGDDTTESWFLTGDDTIVAPYKGSVINRGLGARWSVANVDNSVIFLDDNGIVRRIGGQAGYSAERISTHAVEHDITKGSWRHDDANAYDGAIASTYIEEGHEFYILTIPSLGTWVFDAATQMWHKRKSKALDTFRLSFHINAYDKIICGDTETGTLYEQSLAFAQENNQEIISEIQFPQIYSNGDRFRVHELELMIETQTPQARESTYQDFYLETNDLAFNAFGQDFWNIGAGQETSGAFVHLETWFSGYMGGMRVTDGVARYHPDASYKIEIPTSQFPTTADPFWNDVTMLLLFDGADGSTTFTEEKGSTVVSNGGAVHSNAQSRWGTTSGYFDGVDDWLKVTIGAGAQLADVFTIEAWVYPTATVATTYGASMLSAGQLSFPGRDMNFAIFDNKLRLSRDADGVVNDGIVDATNLEVPLNQWSHVAVVRYDVEGGIVILYVNGRVANLGTNVYTIFTDNVTTDPYVMLDILSDGNRVPDVTQPKRLVGGPGDYGKRIIWRRLGQHREMTPRLTMSGGFNRLMFDATARISNDG